MTILLYTCLVSFIQHPASGIQYRSTRYTDPFAHYRLLPAYSYFNESTGFASAARID